MSTGRQYEVNMNNHLEANPHTLSFSEYKKIMAKLDAQLVREANERKERKENKRNGKRA